MTGYEIFQHHVPGIAAALESCGDLNTVEDVMQAILAKEAQVWGDRRALIITQLFPDDSTVHFWITTGELDATLWWSEAVMSWARGLGYNRATLTGRKGWERVLADSGWRFQAVLLGKDL